MVIKRGLALALCGSMALAAVTPAYATQTTVEPPAVVSPMASVRSETQADLQRLVAPIALYPDQLVAQILAAATNPVEVVEAQRWMAQHTGLQRATLLDEINAQPWDPSIKAIAAFPAVLANMDRNLSWAVALGQAYADQTQAVMDAVQVMRHRAQAAGNLEGTSQEIVVTEGQTISIEPADPDLVYVPEYDPWLAYGLPLAAWPDWYSYPGLYLATPGVFFDLFCGTASLAAFGWGWHRWGLNWDRRRVEFHHDPYSIRNPRLVGRRPFSPPHFAGGFRHAAPGFGRLHAGLDRGPGAFGRFGGEFPHFVSGIHQFGGLQHVAGGFHGGFHGSFGGGFHGGGHR